MASQNRPSLAGHANGPSARRYCARSMQRHRRGRARRKPAALTWPRRIAQVMRCGPRRYLTTIDDGVVDNRTLTAATVVRKVLAGRIDPIHVGNCDKGRANGGAANAAATNAGAANARAAVERRSFFCRRTTPRRLVEVRLDHAGCRVDGRSWLATSALRVIGAPAAQNGAGATRRRAVLPSHVGIRRIARTSR